LVDFDSLRGGISLETEKTEGGTTSRLMLTRAQFRDSGNYTCAPASSISASAMVHVLNGKFFKLFQTNSSVHNSKSNFLLQTDKRKNRTLNI
jgi:hypothetical protein